MTGNGSAAARLYVFFLFPWCNNILLFNFIGVIGVAVAGGCVFGFSLSFSFISFPLLSSYDTTGVSGAGSAPFSLDCSFFLLL